MNVKALKLVHSTVSRKRNVSVSVCVRSPRKKRLRIKLQKLRVSNAVYARIWHLYWLTFRVARFNMGL